MYLWSLSWGYYNRTHAKEVISLARCNKSKLFLLSIDVSVFCLFAFLFPFPFQGYLLVAYHCSLARYNSSFSSLYSMYTITLPSPCELGSYIVFTNRQDST